MNPSIAERLADVHPKMLRAESEGHRKNLADLRPVIGRLVERALELMGLTKKEAAFQMGYEDQGVISRWCSAVERPLFDKLFALDGFEVAYMLAMAERNKAIQVRTVIDIPRSA